MSFSKRLGFKPEQSIQLNGISEALRNRLLNLLTGRFIGAESVNYVIDKLGGIVPSNADLSTDLFNNPALKKATDNFLKMSAKCEWYIIYDSIEHYFECEFFECNDCDDECGIDTEDVCSEYTSRTEFTEQLNDILVDEKSGYRMINGKFVAITNEEELVAVSEATNIPYESVKVHISKALEKYSDRKAPDYENSIKESISAVEAMCCTITGLSGKNATLGNALKRLSDSCVHIHPAMKEAFDKLYGYTSDESGIRHGGIDFTSAPAEDAKYMLVTCSAFINYLIEKCTQIQLLGE